MKPEDFIVEEIIDLKEGSGKYLYVKVKKREWNTIDLVNFISKKLNSKVGFAGLKDRNAITTQYISVYGVSKDRINNLRIKDVELTPLFYGGEAIKMGNLISNKFRINLGFKCKKIDFVANYFGEQRFSKNNVDVALNIFKRNFKKACELIDNKNVNEHLDKNKNDFIGALKKVDRVLLGLIVSSYQSYLFNKYVKDYLKRFKDSFSFEKYTFVENIKKNFDIPLLSFDEYDIYGEYLKEDGLKGVDLIVRSIPDVLPLSGSRKLFVDVNDFNIDGDYVEFSLSKGSYATIVMKKLESYLKLK